MRLKPYSSTPIVRNLIIINALLYILTWLLVAKFNVNIIQYLGLHFWESPNFFPHQLVTYMFLHGGIWHIFFNMFAVYIFGRVLENVWGEKRFLIYYMFTGIGAGLIQLLVNWWQYSSASGIPMYEPVTIGASGAVFGLLLAFGLLFPNTQIMLLFPPIPIKAKYFVIIYALIELNLGVLNFSWDNIAHFAHLGGMVFGYILIKYWNKKSKRFY